MIPVIDLQQDRELPDSNELAMQLGEAASHFGFLTIINHGIPLSDIRKCFQLSEEFFSLSQESKMKLARKQFRQENPNLYRGYFPVLNDDPSQKEGFEFGMCSRPDPGFPETVLWPEHPPMESHFKYMHARLSGLGGSLLSLLSRYLGWPDDRFRKDFEDGMSTFRIMHYPARPGLGDRKALEWKNTSPEDILNAKERDFTVAPAEDEINFSTPDHTDSGFVTLLFQDNCGGLEALSPDGQWVEVPPREGSIVVNLGDVLSSMSEGKLKATRHRVRAPGKSRLSMPFFYEPSPNAMIPYPYRSDQGPVGSRTGGRTGKTSHDGQTLRIGETSHDGQTLRIGETSYDGQAVQQKKTIRYAEFLNTKIRSFGEYTKNS